MGLMLFTWKVCSAKLCCQGGKQVEKKWRSSGKEVGRSRKVVEKWKRSGEEVEN